MTDCVTISLRLVSTLARSGLTLSLPSTLVSPIRCSNIRMHPFGGSPRCPRCVPHCHTWASFQLVDRRGRSLTFVGVGIQVQEGGICGRAGVKRTGSRFSCSITEFGVDVEGHGPRAEGSLIVWVECWKSLTVASVVSQGTYRWTRAIDWYSYVDSAIQQCLTCMICKKRLDALSLVEHDEEVCHASVGSTKLTPSGGHL